ncbi:hypothetical protein OKB67_001936 [Klebsiella oxytoca]
MTNNGEPDYIRYDCGCCGFETIKDWRDNDVCPKCNHKPLNKTELFSAQPAPQSADLQTRALVMWIKRLSLALRSASPDNKLPRAVMDYLRDNGLISITDCLRGNNEEPPA